MWRFLSATFFLSALVTSRNTKHTECDPPTSDADITLDPAPTDNKYIHGQSVTLACDTNTHTASGEPDYTCNNGSFGTVNFQCNEKVSYWTVNGSSQPCREEDGYFKCEAAASHAPSGVYICVQRNVAGVYCKDRPLLSCLDDEVETMTSQCVRRFEMTRLEKPWGTRYLPCYADEFQCEKSKACIPRSWVGNGIDDCSNNQMTWDRSDEEARLGACDNKTEFSCGDKTRCIPRNMVMDGKKDCDDVTDELQPLTCHSDTEFTCPTTGRCILRQYVNDNYSHCQNGEDEDRLDFKCLLELEFPCHGVARRCVPRHWVRNGVRDCSSGGDEADGTFPSCFPPREFGCKDGSRCLPIKYLCDGKQHCRDGSDEIELCHPTPTMYRTANSSVLIPWSFLLHKDTATNVKNTYGLEFRAGRDLSFGFKCDVGEGVGRRAVPQLYIMNNRTVCTSMEDRCFDGSGRFICARCLDGTIISPRQYCDNQLDCPDLSDECACQAPRVEELCASIYPVSQRGRLSSDQICNLKVNGIVTEEYCDHEAGNFDQVTNVRRISRVHCYWEVYSPSWRHTDDGGYCDEIIDCPQKEDECMPECIAHALNDTSSSSWGKVVQYCFPFLHIDNANKQIDFRIAVAENGTKWLAQDSNTDDCLYNVSLSAHGLALSMHVEEITSKRRKDNCLRVISPDRQLDYKSLNNFLCQLKGVPCPWIHQCGHGQAQIPISKVCDLQSDCPDSSDEFNCPSQTHFYCRNRHPLYISRSKVGDGRTDCSDRSDECMPSAFVSFNMIRTRFFRYFIWIIAGCVILFNGLAIHKQIGKLDKVRPKMSYPYFKKILLINLAFADGFSGIVLLAIAIKSVQFSTEYCAFDDTWRSSLACEIIGIFTVTTFQASLNILVLVVAWKLCVTYRRPTTENKLNSILAFFLTLLTWMISLATAVIPTLDGRFSPWVLIQSNLFFSDSVVKQADIERYISRTAQIASVSNYISLKNSSEDVRVDALQDWYFSTESGVANFPHRNIHVGRHFGYYSSSPLCFPALYSNSSPDSDYSLFIIMYNASALLFLCVGYFLILRRKASNTSEGGASEPQMNRMFYTTVVNLLCWLPIITMVIASHAGYLLPYFVHSLSALVLLPLKSLLNPIVLSRLVPRCGRDEERRRLTDDAREMDVITPSSSRLEQ